MKLDAPLLEEEASAGAATSLPEGDADPPRARLAAALRIPAYAIFGALLLYGSGAPVFLVRIRGGIDVPFKVRGVERAGSLADRAVFFPGGPRRPARSVS